MAVVSVLSPESILKKQSLEEIIYEEVKSILSQDNFSNKELISILREKGIKVERRKSKYYNGKLLRINVNTLRKIAGRLRKEIYKSVVDVYCGNKREELPYFKELEFLNQFSLSSYLKRNSSVIKKDDDYYLNINGVEIPYNNGNLFRFVVNVRSNPYAVYLDSQCNIRGFYKLSKEGNKYLL